MTIYLGYAHNQVFISLDWFNDLITSYEMELGFYYLFTSYEIELETHVHVQIENQLGFHELQIACYSQGLEVMRWNYGFMTSLQVMRWKQKHMYMYKLKTNQGFMNYKLHAITRVDKL